jgi:hypothetical protein
VGGRAEDKEKLGSKERRSLNKPDKQCCGSMTFGTDPDPAIDLEDDNKKQLPVFSKAFCLFLFEAVLRIHDILGWLRIRIPDPDLAIFVMNLQDASKKLILTPFFLLTTF